MQDGESSYRESMLEVFLFETTQMVEQLEELLIDIEEQQNLSDTAVNEIFRIMHTIKGSSAMMMYDGISRLAHSLEDLFAELRTNHARNVDCHLLADIVLQTVDFIKSEMQKIERKAEPDGDSTRLTAAIKNFQSSNPSKADKPSKRGENPKKAQQDQPDAMNAPARPLDDDTGQNDDRLSYYRAEAYFEEGCEMENMRAYTLVHQLIPIVALLEYTPGDIIEDEGTADWIRQNGFHLEFSTSKSPDELDEHFTHTLFLEKIVIVPIRKEDAQLLFKAAGGNPGGTGADASGGTDINNSSCESGRIPGNISELADAECAGGGIDTKPEDLHPADDRKISPNNIENSNQNANSTSLKQSLISVNVKKMDMLMDLVGELVIAEAMVTKNPDLDGLALESFNKASRQLSKLTGELQDVVMSMRLIPIANTFQKMQRLVRDMKRKLDKDVDLVLVGEETEIDKNITELLSDPLMHIIRNSLDHGIEDRNTRIESGKNETGKITLEAKNAGGDIWITIRDDGKGLDKDVIYRKAKSLGLVTKEISEYSEKEIHSLIMLPGFSTKDKVTEFSGRGVGMDVVRENISKLGGSITIESKLGFGTVMRIRIPMTLAIIDGMLVGVGKEKYIIPTTTIRESFRAVEQQVVRDTEDNEMLMIRGECYRVLRLHEHLGITANIHELTKGIIVVIEEEGQLLCLFADDLIGKQQVVVKPIPSYLKKSKSLAGCTILGDGNISLILDAKGLINPI